jgi:hypothetical protein
VAPSSNEDGCGSYRTEYRPAAPPTEIEELLRSIYWFTTSSRRQYTVDEFIHDAKAKGLRRAVFIVCFIVDPQKHDTCDLEEEER